MSERTRDELKAKFETGDIPTQQDFADLIDSAYNKAEDDLSAQLAAKVDKVSGKGLSTNDFTDALKNQLLNANALFGKLHEDANGNTIEWGASHHVNGFVTAGTYRIKGQRTNNADGLPIGNVGSGHTLDGILYVFDSSLTSGSGASDDITLTQLLVLSNRVGGQEGGQWMRSGYGASKDSLTWDPWAKMQTNTEVGVVNDAMQLMDSAGNQTLNTALGMNSLTDNGIYSGVYLPNNATSVGSDAETFVMVVINNYATAGASKTIMQIKISSNFSGELIMQTRNTLPGGDGTFTIWQDTSNDKRVGYNSTIGANTTIGSSVTIPSNTEITATSLNNFDELWNSLCGSLGGYNKETGFYELNGITDLTRQEAVDIVADTMKWHFETCRNNTFKGRTNLPFDIWYNGNLNGYLFYTSPNLEIARLQNTLINPERNVTIESIAFFNCHKLKQVLGNIRCKTANGSYFTGCSALEYVDFSSQYSNEVRKSFSMKDSPLLNLETFQRLTRGSYDASSLNPITITVHADVYAKLTGDTTNEAAAALTEDELAQWTALYETALTKNITFAQPSA